jgi:hypothetical protein
MTLPLDHLVLPTHGLDVARPRLSRLGFTVAPDGVHPFGTINCCIYLADGTFLEPLAIGDPGKIEQAALDGNVFVDRDRAFRERNGDEGLSAVVFGASDADADHSRYVAAGVSLGERLDFSRPFIDANGESDTASFRLAFAGRGKNPDAFVFSCERVNAPRVDRAALQAHPNGVVGIRDVVAISSDCANALRLLSVAADSSAGGTVAGALKLPNAALHVVDVDAFEARFGLHVAQSALRFAAVVFGVQDIEALTALLAGNAVEHHLRDGYVIVPPAVGQGAAFVFEEIS